MNTDSLYEPLLSEANLQTAQGPRISNRPVIIRCLRVSLALL